MERGFLRELFTWKDSISWRPSGYVLLCPCLLPPRLHFSPPSRVYLNRHRYQLQFALVPGYSSPTGPPLYLCFHRRFNLCLLGGTLFRVHLSHLHQGIFVFPRFPRSYSPRPARPPHTSHRPLDVSTLARWTCTSDSAGLALALISCHRGSLLVKFPFGFPAICPMPSLSKWATRRDVPTERARKHRCN